LSAKGLATAEALATADAAVKSLVLRILCLFAANHLKSLFTNNLQLKPSPAQSGPIKANQA
jgi:hypothetical protein